MKLLRFKPPVPGCEPTVWLTWRRLARRLHRLSDDECDELLAMLRRQAVAAAGRASYRRYKSWLDWTRDATAADGLRKAFRWIREPAPWAAARWSLNLTR